MFRTYQASDQEEAHSAALYPEGAVRAGCSVITVLRRRRLYLGVEEFGTRCVLILKGSSGQRGD